MSRVFSEVLKRPEPIYGEHKEPLSPKPYRFEFA